MLKPKNFKDLISYMSKNDVKATIVMIDKDGDIIIASRELSHDETTKLLVESATLVSGREFGTTIH